MQKDMAPSFPDNVLELAVHDSQLQSLMPLSGSRLPDDWSECSSYADVIESVLDAYEDRQAIGYRDYEIAKDPSTGRYHRTYLPCFVTISYGEMHDRIKRLAAAWQMHDRHHVSPGEFVCIIGATGIDYATIDLACAYAQTVSVPVQANVASDLDSVFENTAPALVAAAVEDLPIAAELAATHPSVRTLITFDYDPSVDAERETFESAQALLVGKGADVELVTLKELLEFQPATAWRPLPSAPEGMDRLALLVHSSGSTGQPKGVMFTDRLSLNIWSTKPCVPVVRVAYAPMNHMMGRAMIYSTFARGGTVYVTAKRDLSELFEDIRLARPTELAMLPRLLDVIYNHFQTEVTRRECDDESRSAIASQVMAEMREGFLGNRLCSLSCASAPATPEIASFISECFGMPLNDSYGMTEAGLILTNGRIARPPIIDYKLRDVPELGYFGSDKPYPRGELCIRTQTPTPGYFRQPDVTTRLFDAQGYLCTGDIMEERAPDKLVYLERANDVLKLSQGEFVAIGKLVSTFEAHCAAIGQIYVYGNSARPYLLAVIVPDREAVCEALGSEPKEAELKGLIRGAMKSAAEAQALRAVDIPRDFIIEHEPFTFENGLLTSVGKRRRAALKQRYGERLEQLYAALEDRQDKELQELRDDTNLSVREKVVRGLELSLGIQDADVNPAANFADLGGDSLGAANYAALLSEIFGLDISINMILSPAGSIENWARSIEAALDGCGNRPDFARVHGKGADIIRAVDLTPSSFFDAEALKNISHAPPKENVRNVLLTGATGYLGRFLCLEWLEILAKRGGKLTCLVRARNVDSAFERLSAGFASDPDMADRFARLAEKHLEVLTGDVAEPALGLDQPVFDRLAAEIDHIVHCGALVNHVLPYEDLFAANVAGTAEILRLALTSRQKRIDYISSLAVIRFFVRDRGRTEATPLMNKVPLSGALMSGYATSKWAGEQLLQNANARFGLPVNIFRCDMILADRRFSGQINVSDSFTRTICSIVVTGSAPKSFYELARDGSRQFAHYDGLPADFVAAAIAGIGDGAEHGDARNFHVVNHHVNDGVSLDSFTDWIAEAGYRIEYEEPYCDWFEHFEVKLLALPEEQRQRSLLPILGAFAAPGKIAHDDDHIDSTAFIEAVAELPVRHVPALDRDLIGKCLQDLRLLELIPEPQRQPETA